MCDLTSSKRKIDKIEPVGLNNQSKKIFINIQSFSILFDSHGSFV